MQQYNLIGICIASFGITFLGALNESAVSSIYRAFKPVPNIADATITFRSNALITGPTQGIDHNLNQVWALCIRL